MINFLKDFLYNNRWGEWALISLYLSLLSGVILGLQFQTDTPLFSTTTIELLIPYGSYFRSLHFYSSQFFFLFSIIHLVAIFRQTESYRGWLWTKYILSLPVGLLLLFTGYILRGDTTGSSAGMIGENILLAIPLLGNMFNNLLFSITDHGISRVYINHVITLDILWLALLWDHIRRYKVTIGSNLFITAATLISSLFLLAPLEISEPGVFHITGPWFFVGLQELLRFLPIFLAGVLYPASILLALIYLRKESKYFSYLLNYLSLCFLAYLVLTLVGFSR